MNTLYVGTCVGFTVDRITPISSSFWVPVSMRRFVSWITIFIQNTKGKFHSQKLIILYDLHIGSLNNK